MLILTLAMLLAGMMSSVWFARRYPNPSRGQVVAIVASLVASILVMATPANHDSVWFYVCAVIAAVDVSFLLAQARHRLA